MPAEMMNLFAVPLYKSSLDRSFSEEEIACIKQQLGDLILAGSNFSSANKFVLNVGPMANIKQIIQHRIDDYFATVHNTSDKVSLKITQSWLTLTRKGESHHPHIHPNSIASGVLYIDLMEHDGIHFLRNDDDIWYDLTPKEENYYNARRYFIETKVGDIIIFPSTLRHGVRELKDDFQRISLSFNTFFTGQFGNSDLSNYINLDLKT